MNDRNNGSPNPAPPRHFSRRGVLRASLAATAGTLAFPAVSACSSGSAASGSTLRAAGILDATGNVALYGHPMKIAQDAAVAAINDAGGVLGKKIDVTFTDTQSRIDKYTSGARTFAQDPNCVVVHGGVTSASREAMRPVFHRSKQLYFYNNLYEGGVCDRYTFATGGVPTQQIEVLVPYLRKTFGPRIYIVAADYNYGRILASWVKKYAKESGCRIVGEEYFPLEVTEFGDALQKIQRSRADVVCSLLVGTNHAAFYNRFQAIGLKRHMGIASTVLGYGGEQAGMSPEVVEDIVVALPYFEEIETPENKKFVQAVRTTDPGVKYVSDNMNSVWTGWHIWADAVEKAQSFDAEKVIDVLEGGVPYMSPSGPVTMGASHHLTQTVRLAKANNKGGFTILEAKEGIDPVFEIEKCHLAADPNTSTQYTPE